MNILKLLSVALVLFASFADVQASSPDENRFKLYNEELEKKLKLSPQQIEILKQIESKNQEKMNIYLMELETIQHEMAALADENAEQIREVLTEKQKVKYDKYQYQLKKQKNEHKGEEKPSSKKMRVY